VVERSDRAFVLIPNSGSHEYFFGLRKKLLYLTVLFKFALFFTVLYLTFGSSSKSSAFLFSADFRKARFGLKRGTDPTALLVLQGGLPADEAEHGGRRHGVAPLAHGRCGLTPRQMTPSKA